MTKNIAIIGATGNIGRNLCNILLTKNLVLPQNLILFASKRSVDHLFIVNGYEFTIKAITNENFQNIDIFIFNTEADISKEFIPMALATGAYVIDSSSHYRLEKISELIVPPVNRDLINKSQKLYSHANCLASPISTVIAPILKEYNIKRLVISTYQSVSGAGKLPLDEFYEASKTFVNNIIEPNLYNHKETLKSEFFPKQSAFNIIPQVGDLLENKSSSEEYKIEHELKKILNKNLPISVTAVRVPVFVGHSISLNIEFHEEIDLGNINKILRNAEAVILDKEYTTPLELKSNGQVFVGRIRQDNSVNFGLNMWICSDNLNRGAAIDAAEILESLLKLL